MPPHENSLRDNDVTLVIRSPARSRDNYGVVLCLVVKDEAPIHVPVQIWKGEKQTSLLAGSIHNDDCSPCVTTSDSYLFLDCVGTLPPRSLIACW